MFKVAFLPLILMAFSLACNSHFSFRLFAEFPDKRPQLFTEHTRYEPGDVLRANCSTPPSRPRAELRFTINNMPVSKK